MGTLRARRSAARAGERHRCRPSICAQTVPLMMRPGRLALAVALVLIVLVAPTIIKFSTDWLWFGEVGYQHVFLTMLRSQGSLFVIAFAAAVAWLVANIRLALSGIGDL